MNKVILSALVAALVCVGGSVAFADNGTPSSSSLSEMGLSGLEVMSDGDALAIRGKGYNGYRVRPYRPSGASKPWSAAYGNSWANVGHRGAGAGTTNGYAAEGKYAASGENFSEAGKTTTKTKIVDINGSVKSITKINSVYVFAGGFSSSMSF